MRNFTSTVKLHFRRANTCIIYAAIIPSFRRMDPIPGEGGEEGVALTLGLDFICRMHRFGSHYIPE
jgi:hypothetical protein